MTFLTPGFHGCAACVFAGTRPFPLEKRPVNDRTFPSDSLYTSGQRRTKSKPRPLANRLVTGKQMGRGWKPAPAIQEDRAAAGGTPATPIERPHIRRVRSLMRVYPFCKTRSIYSPADIPPYLSAFINSKSSPIGHVCQDMINFYLFRQPNIQECLI